MVEFYSSPLSQKQAFYAVLSGFLLVAIIGTINISFGQTLGFKSSLLVFLFGALIGIMGVSEHTSFIKNVLFMSVIGFIVWSVIAPISTVQNSMVIKKFEFWTLLLIFVAFLDIEIGNAVRRLLHKPQKLKLGFLVTLAIVIYTCSFFGKYIAQFWAKYPGWNLFGVFAMTAVFVAITAYGFKRTRKQIETRLASMGKKTFKRR